MVANLFFRIGIALVRRFSPPGPRWRRITIAIGGAGCLCYLPTVLAEQLGEYRKAGVEIELVNFKGGSQALTAVIGGSADVVSGYYDHCVNLAARNQQLQAFVVYDRFPGLVLGVSPKHANAINAVKDLAGKKVGVSAPGSSTDFFLKFLLRQDRVFRQTAWPSSESASMRRQSPHGAGHGRCRRHARPHPDAARRPSIRR